MQKDNSGMTARSLRAVAQSTMATFKVDHKVG